MRRRGPSPIRPFDGMPPQLVAAAKRLFSVLRLAGPDWAVEAVAAPAAVGRMWPDPANADNQ